MLASVPARPAYMAAVRWSSSDGGESTKDKLDQLASFLETQPEVDRTSRQRGGERGGARAGSRGPQGGRRGGSGPDVQGPTKMFLNGHYYSPHALGPGGMSGQMRRRVQPLLGPTKREAMQTDPIHLLGLKPSKPSLADDSYKNGALLAEFTSEMGKILPRNITGLTRKSQRSIGKAIRRARAFGILPVLSRGRGARGSAGWR
ncbi:hypothetical protein MSPP1_001202 [Malassezia sp. CBS 17886]|nr:hypothetical protein MSPP1_001202 [Malassezia sp. CBS 17886]